MVAYNLYGSSDSSSVGNGALILTNPDAPTMITEFVSSRSATTITFTWLEGTKNGGAAVLDYRVSYDQSTGLYIDIASGIAQT